jgi:hypothetical protein
MSQGVVFFIEGPDDERFIEQVIKPILTTENVNTHTYSKQPDQSVNQAIAGFQGMYRELYLLRDYDEGNQKCQCISERKNFVKNKFKNIRKDQIIIAIDEIEAWYLAGIDAESASDLGIDLFTHTNNVNKCDFVSKLEKSEYTYKKNFQMEIIKKFSIDTAREKNDSFQYCLDRLSPIIDT